MTVRQRLMCGAAILPLLRSMWIIEVMRSGGGGSGTENGG